VDRDGRSDGSERSQGNWRLEHGVDNELHCRNRDGTTQNWKERLNATLKEFNIGVKFTRA